MKIIIHSDIYNIDKNNLEDYQFLSTRQVKEFIYCPSEEILEIDPDDDLAFNDNCQIPFSFIKENIKYTTIK